MRYEGCVCQITDFDVKCLQTKEFISDVYKAKVRCALATMNDDMVFGGGLVAVKQVSGADIELTARAALARALPRPHPPPLSPAPSGLRSHRPSHSPLGRARGQCW